MIPLVSMTGAELRRARERLGLTQREMAEAIGWQRNSIARCERGERPISRVTELAVKYLLLTMGKKHKRKEGRRHGGGTRKAKKD